MGELSTALKAVGGHFSRNWGTYGTVGGGYAGLHALGSGQAQQDYEDKVKAYKDQGLDASKLKPPEYSLNSQSYKKLEGWVDPLLKPLQGLNRVRKGVVDTADSLTSTDTKRWAEQQLAQLHPDTGSDYLRIPNTTLEVPESVAGEGGLGVLALAIAAKKGKLKAFSRPLTVRGVNLNQPVKALIGTSAAGTTLQTLSESGGRMLGRPLVESPANVKAKDEGAVKDAQAFHERRRQYEQDAADERENTKKLVDQEYGSAYGYKPALASAVSGTIGAAAGYMLPEENKMLWSLAGGATGAVLPYIIAKMIPKHAAETQVATTATSPDTKMATGTQPGTPARPIDWHELWNKYKYDIGAGAAGGGAVVAGANAYFNPDERWWSIPTSGGLAGLSYVLARKGNAHRWAYPKEEDLGPMSQQNKGHRSAIHPLMKDGLLYSSYSKMADTQMPDAPKFSEAEMNDLLWDRAKFNMDARQEGWDKGTRLIKNREFIKSIIEPKLSEANMPEEDRQMFGHTMSKILDTMGQSDNPVDAVNEAMQTGKEYRDWQNSRYDKGQSTGTTNKATLPQLQKVKAINQEASRLYPGQDQGTLRSTYIETELKKIGL